MVGEVRKHEGKCCRIINSIPGATNEQPNEIDIDDGQEDNPWVTIEYIEGDKKPQMVRLKSLEKDDDCILRELWK